MFKSCISLVLLFGLSAVSIPAQNDAPKPEKKPVSMSVSYRKIDGNVSVKLTVTQKAGKKNIPVEGPITNLYLNKIKKHDLKTGTGCVTNMMLNEDGEAVYELTGPNMNIVDNKHSFKFIGRMYEDPRFEDTQEEIDITDANIKISVSTKDSLTAITAKLTAWNDTAEAPVKGVKMKLFIKRAFSQLLIGGEDLETDENGEVTATLPKEVIGESNGTLIVGGKVEDNENYGTVQSSTSIPWTVLPKLNAENKGNLWSSGRNAPPALVGIVLTIFIGIWGIIIYLISLLVKIRKIGKIGK